MRFDTGEQKVGGANGTVHAARLGLHGIRVASIAIEEYERGLIAVAARHRDDRCLRSS
jgi:hypothetical protein